MSKEIEVATPEVLLNQEHREAYQKEVTDHKIGLISKLSEKNQNKHKVVEKAMSDLGAAGVNCYLFAEVPMVEGEEEQICQYNTGGLFLKYEGGKVTRESMIETSRFNNKIILAVVHSIFSKAKNWLQESIETNMFQHLVCNAANWIYKGIEPENLKKLKEEIKNGEK